MARAEENYKATSTSLDLLVRQCDHKETMASLFRLGKDSKTGLVTGNMLRKCKYLQSNAQGIVKGECFRSVEITKLDRFFMSWVKWSLDRKF